MLYAIEWIRTQLAAIYDFVHGFLGALTLESIGSFLTYTPALLVLYILAGLLLTFGGFRSHKLISSLAGGAVMGYLGWGIGTAINPDFVSANVLWMLVLAVIGLFFSYFLYVVNVGICAFLVCFAVVRQLLALSIGVGVVVSMAIAVLYCILLIRLHCLRTSIAGGTLLGLITLHYLGYVVSLSVWVACIAIGTTTQYFLRKHYESQERETGEYRPSAPSPPTPEEITAEIAEEKTEKPAKQSDGDPGGVRVA